ncbi:hypothetical protein ACS65S_06000 [Staphylococcus saprophyticus]
MNNTINLLKQSWQLLINLLSVIIILVVFFGFDKSISRQLFNVKEDDFAVSLDLVILSPIITIVFILIVGLFLDYVRNEVYVVVYGFDEQDLDIKLKPPSLHNSTHKEIFFKIEIKHKIKKDTFLELKEPEWLSLQFEGESKVILRQNNNYYFNVKNINNRKDERFQLILRATVVSDEVGKNQNVIEFEKAKINNGKMYFYKLRSKSIIFKQEME